MMHFTGARQHRRPELSHPGDAVAFRGYLRSRSRRQRYRRYHLKGPLGPRQDCRRGGCPADGVRRSADSAESSRPVNVASKPAPGFSRHLLEGPRRRRGPVCLASQADKGVWYVSAHGQTTASTGPFRFPRYLGNQLDQLVVFHDRAHDSWPSTTRPQTTANGPTAALLVGGRALYSLLMLRRFLYLDTIALGQYVTGLEGGAITTSSKRTTKSGGGAGAAEVKVLRLSGEKSREDESSKTFADTEDARFDRLLAAASTSPEALGWNEVLDPDTDFVDIGIGAMVAWECDVYVPEIIQTLARSGEAQKTIAMMQDLLPAAQSLGLDTAGLPGAEEMGAVSRFIEGVSARVLVVGEDDETDWRVAGQTFEEFLHGDIEGRARVVGKVSKIIPEGSWKPFLTFPGMNLLSREERRKIERQKPGPAKERDYLAGPAIMLDILAIYR